MSHHSQYIHNFILTLMHLMLFWLDNQVSYIEVSTCQGKDEYMEACHIRPQYTLHIQLHLVNNYF